MAQLTLILSVVTLIISVVTLIIAILGGFRMIADMIRYIQSRKRNTGKWVLLVIICILPSISYAATDSEQRCRDLGVNCVCSEPLQATAYTERVGGTFYDPNDSSLNPCNGQGDGLGTGYAITRTAGDLTASTLSTILDALPSGHSVARVLKMPEAYTGDLYIGYAFASDTTFNERVAVRWYEYYSSTHGFDDDPASCNASKLFEILRDGSSLIYDEGFGPPSAYNFLTFNSEGSQDCCGFGQLNVNTPSQTMADMSGPDAGFGGVSPYYQYQRGKWLRWEVVVVNRDSTNVANKFETHVYVKNVTDGGSEYEIISSCDTDGGLTSPCSHRASTVFFDFHINGYRQDTCPGYRAYSHVVVAGWDSNAGQRIGAAEEIEGGSFRPSVVMFIEAAPIATSIFWHFRQAIISGILALWMLSGAVFSLAIQKTKQVGYNTATSTMQAVVKVVEKMKS